jgi:hypothetical protein
MIISRQKPDQVQINQSLERDIKGLKSEALRTGSHLSLLDHGFGRLVLGFPQVILHGI